MFLTRNSKRLAEKQNTDSTSKSKISSKCEGAPLNKNVQGSKRNLNRACKQTLQRGILKENKVYDEISAKNKILTKKSTKSSARLAENKLKDNESKNIKRAVISKKNIKAEKENNWSKNQTPLTVPLNKLGKTKISPNRKIKNHFPLKTISGNAVSHVPIWAVSKNPPQKQTKRQFRISDIYNIEKDEDLMNDSPVKKRKIVAAKKPRAIKNKVFFKKNIPLHNSHKDKFLSAKSAKPLRQLTEYKGLTVNSDEDEMNLNIPIQNPEEKPGNSKSAQLSVEKSDSSRTIRHSEKKSETPRIIPVLEHIDSVPEPVDSVLESVFFKAVKGTETPVAGNNVERQEKGEGYVEDCINDCYSSFANIDTSYISLRHSVAKCLGELPNHNNMSPEKHNTVGEGKINNGVENCINECYSSFINLDTSLRESVEKNKGKLMRYDKTPVKSPSIDKTNSEVCKTSTNYQDEEIFLIPKMTSTPENGDNPIIQPVKQLSKNCGLKLTEMSAIPFAVSRNIQFELSECEISPIKPVSDNWETSFFGSSSKRNKNPKNEVCLFEKTTGTTNLKEMAKVQEKIPTVKCKIPKISEKSVGTKTKNNEEDIEVLLQKENTENGFLSNPRQNRKGPMSPLKPIQVDSVSNKIPLNIDRNKAAFPLHMGNKNIGKTHTKAKDLRTVATRIVNNIPDLCNKNSAGKNNLNFHEINLFDSPGKDERTNKKSPLKKMRKNIFPEEAASPSIYEDLFKVITPEKVYQSPLRLKKFKSRTKIALALDRHGKTRSDKDTDYNPKKLVSRTKKADGEKQKTKEKNEEARNMDEMEKLNQHFSDLEKMDLCIE